MMNHIFSAHAMEISINPRYIDWREIENGKPGFGIMTIRSDPEGIIRTWKIMPSEDYPNTPPIIIVFPPDTNITDRNGQIPFVSYRNREESPWLKLVNDYSNPIIPLLNELIIKYHIGI
jgi:hypothetical protein